MYSAPNSIDCYTGPVIKHGVTTTSSTDSGPVAVDGAGTQSDDTDCDTDPNEATTSFAKQRKSVRNSRSTWVLLSTRPVSTRNGQRHGHSSVPWLEIPVRLGAMCVTRQ